jgi:hypothetical protein
VWPLQSPDLTPADFSVLCRIKKSFKPNDEMRGIPMKQLGQYATCLMSFSESQVLGATGLSYVSTVMVDHFNIFCKSSATGHMLFYWHLITSLSSTALSTFSFLMLQLAGCCSVGRQ